MTMLARTVMLALGFAIAIPFPVEARDSTRAYTCGQVRQLIARRGAVVLNTKNQHVYRRFVVHRGFCQPDEITRTYVAPTRSGSCRLKICIEYDPEPFFLYD